ncbi:uncharacterized protein LOC131937409 isoform X2 [Physella acuta]|uniref:uncharacterized protein LOC131937409 isoform X2 n=1 Tax=Physella acuta TaxID=109671 RepID=UPI0027DC8940|nr:uncharacterized protein LOC131937409 isoform X2 [Physella acuta]
MTSHWLLVTLLVAAGSTVQATHHPEIYLLDQQCSQLIDVHLDVRIQMSPDAILPANSYCSLSLRPASGTALIAIFRSFDLDPKYRNTTDSCQVESLQLMWPGGNYFDRGYCGSGPPQGQYLLGNLGTVGYTTWNFSDIAALQFDLLVTEIFYKSSTCPNQTFDCRRQNLCVDRQLTCNGLNDCGNNLDEVDGCQHTAAIVTGAVIGAVGILLIIACFLLLLRRRGRLSGVSYIRYP